MNSDADNFWANVCRRLRRVLGRDIPSIEEAEAELNAAKDLPLAPNQVDEIVASVQDSLTADVWDEGGVAEDAALSAPELCDWSALVLNRNPGAPEEFAEERIQEVRWEALAGSKKGIERSRFDWLLQQQSQEKAAEAAEELVQSIGIDTVPIDPFAIARDEFPLLCIDCRDFNDRFDGQLQYEMRSGQFVLLLNNKYDAFWTQQGHHPRTRFSLAHELGHYFLEGHRDYLKNGGVPHASQAEYRRDSLVEREADAFAAALLMPSMLIAPMVNEAELSRNRLEKIANYFQTSLTSTAIRSVLISDFPCALIGIADGGVRWSFHSKPLIQAGCYPKGKSDHLLKRVRSHWEMMLSQDGTEHVQQGILMEWFETYDRSHLINVPVCEHYMPVRTMNLLIILITLDERDVFDVDADDFEETDDD